ncbi:hypothetical protein C8R48DRAFT_712746, partial [Suillus tomentosus]
VQPTLVQKICSSVRLLSRSATVLGRYGTMLLLDNHDPDGMAYSDFQHQRLSVRILTATGGSSTSPHSSHDSMAFRILGGSYWNSAAIDEESGRIVVSNVDGMITLFEYL